MYKAVPQKYVYSALLWLMMAVVLTAMKFNALLSIDIKLTSLVGPVMLIFTALLWKPVWRFFWWRIPLLNSFIFPDLNGIWAVEMDSNWPIQTQLLDAASGISPPIDLRTCAATNIANLQVVNLEAEISQSWLKIEIVMTNPLKDTPIQRSDVISADPFRKDGLSLGGLYYFYKQENRSNNPGDAKVFYGAARVEYDPKTDTLNGIFWTERMWDRGMNTAGRIKFSRK